MTTEKRLNVAKLVHDLGGSAKVAKITGTNRTSPYGWIKRNYISSRFLAKIKAAVPQLDLNYYFEDVDRNDYGGAKWTS
jgi:hypothetical protein